MCFKAIKLPGILPTDICEKDLPKDYLINSNVYLHGRDTDGKLILMFKCRTHFRGSRSADDLKRCLVYWIERGFRETKGDKLTVVFDMLSTGMGNIDMDYTKNIINIFKQYYPNSLNWILVYDMPWIMNGEHAELSNVKSFSPTSISLPATFQIVKKLLPKKAVEILKFVNAKSIREYIDDDNMPVDWGGRDDYVFSFESEKRHDSQDDEVIHQNGVSRQPASNNNSDEHENLNLLHRKVSPLTKLKFHVE